MATAIRPGDLRSRITLQTRGTSQDNTGQQVNTWTDTAIVWAAIEEAGTKELLAAQAFNTSVTHTVTIRYQRQFADPKVMAAMRIKWNKDGVTRYFNIKGSKDNEERRRYLTLDVEEGLNNG